MSFNYNDIYTAGKKINASAPSYFGPPHGVPGPSYVDTPAILSNLSEGRGNFSVIQNFRQDGFQRRSLKRYADGAYSIVGTLTALWTQAVTTRQDYLMNSAELRRFYLVDHMLQLIADDVLNPDEKGDIVQFVSADPQIQEELNKLQRRFDFNVWLTDITKDFIDFGEYTLRMEIDGGEDGRDGQGVIGLFDDVNQLNVVSFYEDGMPKRYLMWEENDWKIMGANTHVHFVTGNDKLRVKLEAQMNNGATLGQGSSFGMPIMPMPFSGGGNNVDRNSEAYKDLPDYIRLGKPIFYGVIPKIRELMLLEQLIPAAKLNQVTQSQLVAVKVPAATPPQEVAEILRHFEDLLNSPTGIDANRMELSLAEVLTAAGHTRVIPQFSDDKGALEALNVRASQPIDDLINSVNDLRRVILSSIGIPPSLLYGPQQDGGDSSKAQELHIYSRYTRRLAALQGALARGLKQICFAHCVNRGLSVRKHDIDVLFTNTLTDLSGLERLEFQSAKQDLVGKTVDLTTAIMGNPLLAAGVDKRGLLRYVKSQFDLLTDEISIFQDPDRVQLNPTGAPGGDTAGGAGGPMSDVAGGEPMGNSPMDVPNPVGGAEAGSDAGTTPSFDARKGAEQPGSGSINIQAT